MTKRQFLLGTFVLMTVIALGGVVGYFALENRRVRLEEEKVAAEVDKYEADKKTERTKERWSFLPDFRSNKDED